MLSCIPARSPSRIQWPQKLVDADFIDEEDLEKKVLPYIMEHSTKPGQSSSTTTERDGRNECDAAKRRHAALPPCYDSTDEAEDAAWFQLFGLLEKYGTVVGGQTNARKDCSLSRTGTFLERC